MLQEQINADFNTARKEKNTERVLTLNSIRAEFLSLEKANQKALTEDEVMVCLKKVEKQLQQSITGCIAANRADALPEYESQLKIVQEYLPKLASIRTVYETIESVVESGKIVSLKEVGKIMGSIKAKLGQSVDMKLAGALAKKYLRIVEARIVRAEEEKLKQV